MKFRAYQLESDISESDLYSPATAYKGFGFFYIALMVLTIFLGRDFIISGNAKETIPSSIVTSIKFQGKPTQEVKNVQEQVQVEAPKPPKPEISNTSDKRTSNKPDIKTSKAVSKDDKKKAKKDDSKPSKSETQKQEASPSTPSSNQSGEVSDVVAMPAQYKGKGNIVPKYPLISYQLGEKGEVIISYKVSETGEPFDIKIEKSSGFIRLDNAALSQFSSWKFEPARNVLGTMIRSSTQRVKFVFNIEYSEIKDEE